MTLGKIRFLVVLLTVTAQSAATAQAPARLAIEPEMLQLEVGDTVRLTATVFDADGNTIDAPVMFFSTSRRRLAVDRAGGVVQAVKGGSYEILAFVVTDRTVEATVAVEVAFPPAAEVSISPSGTRFFVGASVRHEATVVDAAGDVRRDIPIRWSTDDPTVASFNRVGVLTAHAEGPVTITATAEDVAESHIYEVVTNPIRTVVVELSADSVKTGDVVHARASALDARGQIIEDAPIVFTLIANPEDTVVAQSPAAEIDDRGRFVAQKAGDYTILAIAPGHVTQQSLQVENRHVSQEVTFVGQGAVRDVRTSDLWIWSGVNGRDYGVTGTWGAQGAAYFWDVTDPATPVLTDSVVVDARTVNDVKVSEDGRIAVISREGASNRRNGIVILDVTDAHDVKTLATYDDELTGGVHNLFVYQNHVYAVNNGRRFDVINIEDPTNPYRVSRFELDTPGHGIHDIWIVDGIAYTSNWGDGVV
ncbi:MAG: Ig-like domain-containing protein, partial [Gemmatimonadota bacterium]|nr:Ig-like domain-containing protein [Gemmatimonadota bacterium]